jgi:hypothetical protein
MSVTRRNGTKILLPRSGRDDFGHPKGHVTRCLARIKDELRATFDVAPEMLDLPDDEVDLVATAESSGTPSIDPTSFADQEA